MVLRRTKGDMTLNMVGAAMLVLLVVVVMSFGITGCAKKGQESINLGFHSAEYDYDSDGRNDVIDNCPCTGLDQSGLEVSSNPPCRNYDVVAQASIDEPKFISADDCDAALKTYYESKNVKE